ncbi:hypothetical protein [Blastomonas sp. CCH5-A3]|jgi:type IV secretory pathway TrbF-like protein|uniref:hypothetical protein n=1 Tax=Blastomonas sp. CCH5-A3 TaxID=1768761 RepID=UPI000826B38E|nr:hypothetical protein [Blastomonas sp. CCH5-A3]MAF60231.1 hypothetical protein [Blastomonas sp.]|tara:strand:- start:107446 stop:107661 length:216 start_codon:yes stop_codon:yes gene_type:complete
MTTPWDFDTHRGQMRRYSRVNRRIGFGIMALVAVMILGCIFTAVYLVSIVSLDDVARKAGELTRTFRESAR